MLYRWTCGCTWTLLLFTVGAQQTDMLMHSDFVNYYYCSLWMPQQTDLLLHMDIFNIVVIVIILINCKIPGVNTTSVMQDE